MSVDLGEGVCEQIQHGTAGKAAVLECKAEAEEGKEEVRTEAEAAPHLPRVSVLRLHHDGSLHAC